MYGVKKRITVTLEYETTADPIDDRLDLIREDLVQEISCCWHIFDVIDVRMEDAK